MAPGPSGRPLLGVLAVDNGEGPALAHVLNDLILPREMRQDCISPKVGAESLQTPEDQEGEAPRNTQPPSQDPGPGSRLPEALLQRSGAGRRSFGTSDRQIMQGAEMRPNVGEPGTVREGENVRPDPSAPRLGLGDGVGVGGGRGAEKHSYDPTPELSYAE